MRTAGTAATPDPAPGATLLDVSRQVLSLGGVLLALAVVVVKMVAGPPGLGWYLLAWALFVAALWLNKPAAGLAREYYSEMRFTWLRRPDICLVAGGLMLVGSGVAIVLARLVRRLVEPRRT